MRQPEYSRLDQLPAIGADEVPWLSVDEIRAVDRIAIETGMLLEQMMENAGRSLTAVGRRLLGGSLGNKRVVILVGSGGNGGGGLVAARHLASAGAAVSVALDRPPSELAEVPSRQLMLARAAGIRVNEAELPENESELIVDALLGYGQLGTTRGRTTELGLAITSPFDHGPIVRLLS